MKAESIDHIVLTVKNIDTSVSFYTSIMGMEKIVFGDNRVALLFGNQKINLHQLGNEFEPKAHNVKVGSADLCFIINQPINKAIEHLHLCNIPIIEGPVSRTGAVGKVVSVYFRDPDGNLIEVSSYETISNTKNKRNDL
ncbi:MAG: VOC family protein [Cellvibrionaceae bacterium]